MAISEALSELRELLCEDLSDLHILGRIQDILLYNDTELVHKYIVDHIGPLDPEKLGYPTYKLISEIYSNIIISKVIKEFPISIKAFCDKWGGEYSLEDIWCEQPDIKPCSHRYLEIKIFNLPSVLRIFENRFNQSDEVVFQVFKKEAFVSREILNWSEWRQNRRGAVSTCTFELRPISKVETFNTVMKHLIYLLAKTNDAYATVAAITTLSTSEFI